MARLARLYAVRVPQLVQVELAHPLAQPADATPQVELDQTLTWLRAEVAAQRIALHGYVLLLDRIVLLATPPASESMPRLVQAMGRRLATRLRHGRVFAGRYRSTLVEPGRWVLPALIWLESLPVHLGYVAVAEHWPWSSAALHAGASTPPGAWTTEHADYWANGNTPFARQAAYRTRLQENITRSQAERIRRALIGQWALAETDFLQRLQAQSTRRPSPARRGRPPLSREKKQPV